MTRTWTTRSVKSQWTRPQVDWSSNCGNMSSAIGPFAVDEGMVAAPGPEGVVVIHNTNTGKLIRSRFPVEDGRAAVEGETTIPGVPGTGAPVDLEFLDPGGAGTGTLLPTGNVLDLLEVEGAGSVPVSLVDAANPFVFVDASNVGITGTEMPAALDARPEVMERLERVRAAAAMGIAASPAEASTRFPSAPKIRHLRSCLFDSWTVAADFVVVAYAGSTKHGDDPLAARITHEPMNRAETSGDFRTLIEFKFPTSPRVHFIVPVAVELVAM